MVTSRQRSERHLQNILRSTRGIAFLGTPHHGAGLARWAELLYRTISAIKQTDAQIVEVLRRDSEVLARVQDSFHTMVMARNKEGLKPIEISCFYEELPLPAVGLVGLARFASLWRLMPYHRSCRKIRQFSLGILLTLPTPIDPLGMRCLYMSACVQEPQGSRPSPTLDLRGKT